MYLHVGSIALLRVYEFIQDCNLFKLVVPLLEDEESSELAYLGYQPFWMNSLVAVTKSQQMFFQANIDLYMKGEITEEQAIFNEFAMANGWHWVDRPKTVTNMTRSVS